MPEVNLPTISLAYFPLLISTLWPSVYLKSYLSLLVRKKKKKNYYSWITCPTKDLNYLKMVSINILSWPITSLNLIILRWMFCCNYPIKLFHCDFQLFLVLKRYLFLNQYFLSKSNFASLETVSITVDIVDCHEWVGKRMCFLHLMGRGTGAPQHPTMQKTASHKTELSGQISILPN